MEYIQLALKQINDGMELKNLTIAVIGLGQIGASLAAGLKGKVNTIVGFDIDPLNEEFCMNAGIIDTSNTLEEICQMADVVAIATPVDQVMPIASRILSASGKPLAVFDVGSTKSIINIVLSTLPERSKFVSSHPMAGSAEQGAVNASASLFRNKLVYICDEHLCSKQAVELITGLWDLLGARVEFIDSNQHDKLMANVSHLPQLVSYALAIASVNRIGSLNQTMEAASSGFDSMTRLAKSSASMWLPIVKQNKENILSAIVEFQKQLNRIELAIRQNDDQTLQWLIVQANGIRKAFENQQNQNILNHGKRKVKN